jgi:CPA2 family monovalent cation:H+ antiporter-2
LGALTAVQLDSTSQATGRSLAELNLRGLTGATVLAITRDEGGVIIPTAEERLHEGDVLALAGSHEAIEAARKLLTA